MNMPKNKIVAEKDGAKQEFGSVKDFAAFVGTAPGTIYQYVSQGKSKIKGWSFAYSERPQLDYRNMTLDEIVTSGATTYAILQAIQARRAMNGEH